MIDQAASSKVLRLLPVALLAGVIAVATPAAADYAPGEQADISTSDATPSPGDPITIRVVRDPSAPPEANFASASEMSVLLFSSPTLLGTMRSDAGGNAVGTFKIPSDTDSGGHRVEVRGTSMAGTPLRVTRAITVVGGASDRRRSEDAEGNKSGLPTMLLITVASLVVLGAVVLRRVLT